MTLTFEWNAEKALRNLAKHRVSFDEASTVFSDPLGRIVSDTRHSGGEERLVVIGRSSAQQLLTVMFTDRKNRIRIISARHVTRTERRQYEENAR